MIALDHPALTGFREKDWWLWAGGRKGLSRNYVTPLSAGVVLSVGKGSSNGEFGMFLSEIRVGKGVCLFSQVDAVSLYGKNSTATQYLHNLLAYVLGDAWQDKYAAPMRGTVPARWQPPDRKRCFTVDLRPYCNRGFTDKTERDRKGGWSDDGAKYDLRLAPIGRQVFHGVPFDIIDPAANKGRSCIVLRGGPVRTYFPEKAENIVIGKGRVRRLFFLVTAAWAPKKSGVEVGRIRIRYVWGGAGTLEDVSVPLVTGRNIGEWTSPVDILPESFLGWDGLHPLSGKRVGLYLVPWTNKIPEKIVAVDFISTSTERGVPILVAISGETDG